MQAHTHNMQMHMGSHFDLKSFFKVSLPALQVPANNQSMAVPVLDPEVAFGPQKEWISPIMERPWVGPNAESLIPVGATEEDVKEALELWGMPEEAWPETGKQNSVDKLLDYTLHKNRRPDIRVHLRRQVFTTHPPHAKHTYFSFWMSPEHEVGPVANPYGIGYNHCKSKGYNHCNAALAFGEIQLLAGWANEPFLLQWHTQFNVHKTPDQQFPPMLRDWILLQDMSSNADQHCLKMSMITSMLEDEDKMELLDYAPLANPDHQDAPSSTSAEAPAQPDQLPDVEELMPQDAPYLLLGEATINTSTSADQLPNESFQLLDVDQIYLFHHNGGANIINAKTIGPDAKKKMVDGKKVIKLCDDGIHRVVWEVPRADDLEGYEWMKVYEGNASTWQKFDNAS